jgi:cytochrome P450
VEDLRIDGKQIASGEYVLLFLGAANRDPERFPAPDRFDILRGDNQHLTFGLGPHFCLGASLARLECEIVFRTLLRRLPGLQLIDNTASWRSTFSSRGLATLPVTYEPATMPKSYPSP